MAELPSPWPPENRTRGTLLALLIIPAAVILWVIVWTLGWIVGIIAAGVGAGALALYALGSGGRVSFNAALRITTITVITLPIAFLAGIVADNPAYLALALQRGDVIRGLAATLATYPASDIAFPLLFGVVCGASGLIAVFRVAFAQRKQLKTASIVIDPYA